MVYLIHFEKKLGHAQHYIGYAADDKFENRIKCHKKGCGSRILNAANKAGINWEVVRTWKGDRKLERKLKNWKKASQLCPVCREEKSKYIGG